MAVAVIVGGLSFYGGMKYGQSSSASGNQGAAAAGFYGAGGRQARAGGSTAGGAGGGFSRGGLVAGEILSKDTQSMTVKLADGSTKIVLLSASTAVSKSAVGSTDDLKVGLHVAAMGTVNQDGSVTSETIQIRPAMASPK